MVSQDPLCETRSCRSRCPRGTGPAPHALDLSRGQCLRTFRIEHSQFVVPPLSEPDAPFAVEADETRICSARGDGVLDELFGLGIESRDVVSAEIGVPDVAGFI